MIKANELRIGNWVRYAGIGMKSDQDYCIITELKKGQDITGVEPIPLTPEILEKAGFRIESINTQIEGFKDYYTINIPTEYSSRRQIVMSFNGKFITYGMEIKYLHQLQNLFYALTGEELNIQL